MKLLLPLFLSFLLLSCSNPESGEGNNVDTSLTNNQPPKLIEKKVEKIFNKYFYFTEIDMNDEYVNYPSIRFVIDIEILSKEETSPFKNDSTLTNNEFIINGKYSLKIPKLDLTPQNYEIWADGAREEMRKTGNIYLFRLYEINKMILNDFADKEGTRFDIYRNKLMKIELKCDQAEIVQEFN